MGTFFDKCENCQSTEELSDYGIIVSDDLGKMVTLCEDCFVIVYQCGDVRE